MRNEINLGNKLCGAAVTYWRSLYTVQQGQCWPQSCLPQKPRLLQTLTNAPEQFVSLNNLRENPGAARAVSTDMLISMFTIISAATCFCESVAETWSLMPQPKRVGRGTGSGLGKTAGRGHKGQKARTGTL